MPVLKRDGTPREDSPRHVLLHQVERRVTLMERLFDQHDAVLVRLETRITSLEHILAGLQRDRDANAGSGSLEERVSELEQERD